MKIKTSLKKGVCSAVSLSILMFPGWSYAGETNMSAIGREAQQFGKDLGAQDLPNQIKMTGSQVTFPVGDGTMSFDKSEMTPTKTSPGSKITIQTDQSVIDALMGIHDDGDEMSMQGTDKQESLYEYASRDEPKTLEGNVYKILTEAYNLDKPDMSNDSIFDTTKELVENLEEIAEGLVNCEADTTLTEITNKKHVPEYKTCEKVLDRSGTCKLTHYYQAGVVAHYSGPTNVDTCGEGCMVVWLGKVGNNYIDGGSCRLWEEELELMVLNPDAIQRAEIDYAAFDDQMQIWIGPKGREVKVYQGPNDNTFPYKDTSSDRVPGVACELNHHWIWDPYGDGFGCTESACGYVQQGKAPVNVTTQLKAAGKNGIVRMKLRDAIGGQGEAYARLRIRYDAQASIYEEQWTPPECVETLKAISDGYAEGTSKCTKMPVLDKNGCTYMNGVTLCPEHMVMPPNSDINPLCQEMELTSDYNFYKGQMDCWIDANGNKQCPENIGGKLDTCQELEDDPKCTFIKSECVEGAEGASGTCYVADQTYDCGEDVSVTDTEANTNYNCPGDVACMGNDCIDTSQTVSTSFAQVTALLNAMQYMTQDMECTGLDDDGHATQVENVTCKVFSGEAGWCKKAVGGVQDCCEAPNGIGLGSYITMIKGMADLNSALDSMSKLEGDGNMLWKDIGSGWVDMKGDAMGVVKDGMSWVTDNFTSFGDSIGGFTDTVSGFFSEVSALRDQIINNLKDKVAQILDQIFQQAGMDVGGAAGGAAAGSASEEAAKEAVSQGAQVVQGAATMFAVISWIYTAYVVATMIIQMVYACEDTEFETRISVPYFTSRHP